MRFHRWLRGLAVAGLALSGWGAGTALAYTAPYSTPPGITLVDVSGTGHGIPQLLWRRLGDASGRPLYTYDADARGKSSCYADCAKDFPPFLAEAHARASGDFSIVARDDGLRQWAYQGRPLYRYSGHDPVGEPASGAFTPGEDTARYQHDPASAVYSPKRGWRRAAFTPERSTAMPPSVELDGLAVANGFGFVDATTHLTIYAVPVSHRLSGEWHPLRASSLALPVGDFAVIRRKDDGSRQWTYRGQALYTYAGDYAPGEVTGLAGGDQAIQAALAYRNFIPPGIEIGHYVGRGPLMTTSKGMTLYTVARFYALYGGRETRTGYSITYNDAKSQGAEGCQGECTATWQPLLAPANAQAWGFWEVIVRSNGSRQWMFKGSPVYTYADDRKPGDIEGNNRHVILYGGSDGQIVYADAGGDPRRPQPSLGQINLLAAVGPKPQRAAAAAPNPTQKALNALYAGAVAFGVAQSDGRAGAGFYWHMVGLFY